MTGTGRHGSKPLIMRLVGSPDRSLFFSFAFRLTSDGLGGHWDYWGTGCAFHVLFFSDSLFVYPTGFFLVSTGILQGESGEGEILLTSNGLGQDGEGGDGERERQGGWNPKNSCPKTVLFL